MGFYLNENDLNAILECLGKEYKIYGPIRITGGNTFSDVDCIRYGVIKKARDIVFDQKSNYSFKEVLFPVSQTLLSFTDERICEAAPDEKGIIICLRSCDLHAVKRLDGIFLQNGRNEDYYYKRLRKRTKFILMGCRKAFDSCFCVDMGTNQTNEYDMSLEPTDGGFLVDNRCDEWSRLLKEHCMDQRVVIPSHVSETKNHVLIPNELSPEVGKSKIWDEYDSRCINCGRCNFVCPTCTCFTMQDISESRVVGERRRVHASCMVNGFTDIAGGGSFRKKNGERMRFKVLHKVYDFKERFGYQMCVGCGRCDDICPEYISFSHCVNRLQDAVEEVKDYAAK